jgi:hypothetical protein
MSNFGNRNTGFFAATGGGGGASSSIVILGGGAGSTLRCGVNNTASGTYSTVFGCSNTASGCYSSIVGGRGNNTCAFADSFIIGSNISATAACTTFVNNISGGVANFTNSDYNTCAISATQSGQYAEAIRGTNSGNYSCGIFGCSTGDSGYGGYFQDNSCGGGYGLAAYSQNGIGLDTRSNSGFIHAIIGDCSSNKGIIVKQSGFTLFGTNTDNLVDRVQINGTLSANNVEKLVTLTSNVVNNNAVANTIQNITGMSFPLVGGATYQFRAVLAYNSAATTTGSRFSVTGSAAPTSLNYTSTYTLTATTQTLNYATAYDIPAASNLTSLTTGNVAMIFGQITPSISGTFFLRFASEVANSAITVLAGSSLRYLQVI